MSKKEKVEKHAHLVDKWILTESIFHGGVVSSKPNLVTKVSGDRIYISKRDYCPVDQTEGELVEDSFIRFKTVKYVFDSEEKANEAAAQCKTLHWHWWTTQMKAMREESIRILKELSNG
ncbi:hypothetical protein F485_gp407 [Aeromonas phage CC2]|uniref:Uncharacterized protein n=1 Tax=Aeromonas phage CC2 TaxID=1204516 RepID=I6WBY3_9CAUD|nr:hypothetical protein F485_gp407 [Aeromonas phage CC2]AFN39455.1 hypothetical protein CC2_407 [Aeromonas phage CC2]